MKFTKTSPCNNCPYRKDAPLQHWHKSEFTDLLAHERSTLGVVYGCHKKDGNVCIGWLMNQDENGIPSINLRMAGNAGKFTREYLDSLTCRSERFETVLDMCQANYPEIK